MKTSIRNKLTALILAVCLSIILIIWLTTTLFFKPMYYNATQTELTGILSKTVRAIKNNNGQLDQYVTSEIQSYIKSGVCIEISDEQGAGLVLMEGIGDACQLHGGKDFFPAPGRHGTVGQTGVFIVQKQIFTAFALIGGERVVMSV